MAPQAKLRIALDRPIGSVSPYVFGTATYAAGTDAYWVGEDSPIPNIRGFRRDTVRYLRRLSPQVTSYYHGLFCDWRDAVGPRDSRPPLFDPIGRAVFEETPMDRDPTFGIDEFLQFCELIGSEALLRIADDDVRSARNLVEYCNYEGTSRYAEMRRANGHPEPYGVKFWQWYAWWDPAAHARTLRDFSWVARCIDPNIRVLCAQQGAYAERFFAELENVPDQEMGGASLVDYICSINYLGGFDDEQDIDEESVYRVMHNAAGLEKLFIDNDAAIQRHAEGRKPFGRFRTIDWLGRPASNERMGTAVTEWGISHRFRSGTFRDALVCANVLDIYCRLSAVVPLATLTWTANMGSGLLLTDGEATITTPMYHLFDLYRVHKGNTALAVTVEADEIRPTAAVTDADSVPLAGDAMTELPPLAVVGAAASRDPHGERLFLSVTNRHLRQDVEVQIAIDGAGAITAGSVATLNADRIEDRNDASDPERITTTTSPFTPRSAPFSIVLPAHSISTLSLTLGR